jgi:hypothetical protein
MVISYIKTGEGRHVRRHSRTSGGNVRERVITRVTQMMGQCVGKVREGGRGGEGGRGEEGKEVVGGGRRESV